MDRDWLSRAIRDAQHAFPFWTHQPREITEAQETHRPAKAHPLIFFERRAKLSPEILLRQKHGVLRSSLTPWVRSREVPQLPAADLDPDSDVGEKTVRFYTDPLTGTATTREFQIGAVYTSAFLPDHLRSVESFDVLWCRLTDEIYARMRSLALACEANAVVAFRLEISPWFDYEGERGMWVDAYGVAALVA